MRPVSLNCIFLILSFLLITCVFTCEHNVTTANGGSHEREGSSEPVEPTTRKIQSTMKPTVLTTTRAYPSKDQASDKVLICYYGTWAVYRPGNGKFAVENIDPFLCTHVIYSFAGLGYDNRIRALDPWNDLPDNYGKGAYIRFVNLKKVNPKLKTLIAIGGWNEGSIKYSNMAADPSARATFVESVVQFLEKYNFDGLDMDWEYPASRGGKPEDRANFVELLRDLKTAFEPKNYLLTAAVSAGKWNIDPAYDVPQVSKYLDYINVMCYDYHGGWEDKTGHNAPLFPRSDELANDRLSNVNFSVNYWITQGASKSKLVMGMATYGRSFTLAKEQDNGLRASAPQKGQAGPYTREAGSLGYNEICEFQQKAPAAWTVVRDPYYMAPYAYSGRQWVGYDDVESIKLKTRYINQMGLAGAMIWSLETDDFLGKCSESPYPLLNAIKTELESGNSDVPEPPMNLTKSADDPKVSTTSTSSTTTTSTTTTMKPMSIKPSTFAWPFTYSTKNAVPSSTPCPHHDEPLSSSSSPSVTSTTTTTVKPSTSPPSNRENKASSDDMICSSSGMFRYPKDCKKFYRCVQVGTRFHKYEYNCPDETVFDTETQICLWPDSVPECRNYYSQNEIGSNR